MHRVPNIHSFKANQNFYLDGQPFQIISGEIHPARIPAEYWRHRIQMAKAMGCNTIAAYIFWNYHESEEGVYDFSTGNHNLSEFFKIVQEEGMFLIVRPGPYVCAEWEFGGLPPYLLRIPDIKVRCMDPRYMTAAERYIRKLVGGDKAIHDHKRRADTLCCRLRMNMAVTGMTGITCSG